MVNEGQPTLSGIGCPYRSVAQVLPHGPKFDLLAIRSSPQFGLSATISGSNCRSHGASEAFRLVWTSSARTEPKSIALPSEERIWLHIQQPPPPREHAAEGGHRPSGGIVGPSWFDLFAPGNSPVACEGRDFLPPRHCGNAPRGKQVGPGRRRTKTGSQRSVPRRGKPMRATGTLRIALYRTLP
jgi:hypothetical protein